MHVLVVSPEIAPLNPSGDLAAAAGGLVQALCQLGLEVTVVMPFDDRVSAQRHALARRLRKLTVHCCGETYDLGLLEGTVGTSSARVFLLDHPATFQSGNSTGQSGNSTGADRILRADLLAAGAAQLMQDYPLAPDLVHAFGPDAALVATRVSCCQNAADPKTPLVLTQVDPEDCGPLSPSDIASLTANPQVSSEALGDEPANLLAVGLQHADMVTVPSPSLADALKGTARPGTPAAPFDSRGKPVAGVLPGLDYTTWTPEANRHIAAPYSAENRIHKQLCKGALIARLGLTPRPLVPLVAVPTSTLTDKQARQLIPALTQSLGGAVQLALYGTPPSEAQAALTDLSEQHARDVGWLEDADVDALHILLAGSDALIAVPSHPATLIELLFKALSYGAVPLALGDSVAQDVIVDYDATSMTGTGLLVGELDIDSLGPAIQRLVDLYVAEHRWGPLQRNAMQQRFDWAASAAHYEHVYRGLLTPSSPPPVVTAGEHQDAVA